MTIKDYLKKHPLSEAEFRGAGTNGEIQIVLADIMEENLADQASFYARLDPILQAQIGGIAVLMDILERRGVMLRPVTVEIEELKRMVGEK